MTRSPFMTLAKRIVAGWQRHQRAKRWSRLCRANKKLSAACEALSRHRKAHKPTRADLATIKAVVTEQLRGEVIG
jgi:hypothetical protein